MPQPGGKVGRGSPDRAVPDTGARLIRAVRAALAREADPARARAMQAYMKSAMPYHGVPTAAQRAIFKDLFPRFPLSGFDEWRDTALTLWRGARRREERYAAIALTGHPLYESCQVLASLSLYEEMIVTGAWWDYVDGIAAHRLGNLLRRRPGPVKRRMLSWSRSREMWKRRAALLCQLTFKDETDLSLLYACIEATMGEREFFIRKAIGWALREYAWTDPAEVRRFVARHRSGLSPLSRREALKNLGRGV